MKTKPSDGAFGRSQQKALAHRQRFHQATVANATSTVGATARAVAASRHEFCAVPLKKICPELSLLGRFPMASTVRIEL